MQFNSYSFILMFFPIVCLLYFPMNRIHRKCGDLILLFMGVIFYFQAGTSAFLILLTSAVLNFAVSLWIQKGNASKLALYLALIGNISVLFGFKYLEFFAVKILGFKMLQSNGFFPNIAIPLGISFFTFQQISYVVSFYRGEIRDISILDYLIYVFYFPKLIMGPLVEPKEFIGQLHIEERKKVNYDNFAFGIRLFCVGLIKKMILADTFTPLVTWGFQNVSNLTSTDCVILMLAYTMEIYFDFSGYSDMAIGTSKMLNIDLPINFDSPYKAVSIRDFWKRWHISLTKFFTKYVYIPLGGSRAGELFTNRNIMIVFLLSGIWHGANWTFILWGIIHGVLNVIDRYMEKVWAKMKFQKIIHVIRWGCTFAWINVLWLLFRSESVEQWLTILKRLFSFQSFSISNGFWESFYMPELQVFISLFRLEFLNMIPRMDKIFLLLFFLLAMGICLLTRNLHDKSQNDDKRKYTAWGAVCTAILFVWGFICLGTESTFVYFSF